MLTDRRYCYPLTITDFASRSAFLQQQAKFDHFMHEYNFERPHQRWA